MRTIVRNFQLTIFRFVTCLLISLPSISFPANNLQNFSDWHPAAECIRKDSSNPNIASFNAKTSFLCNGCYQEPGYPFALNDKQNFPTKITSDTGEFISKGDSTFLGNVIAKQGNRTIYADKAIIQHNATSGELENIHAIGNFRLTEPGIRIDGSRADINYPESKKVIYDANFRLYSKHLRGKAKTITTIGKSKLLLPRASYSTCAPGKNTWEMRTKKSRFNRDTGRGEAWHARLYVKNVPVFYWPYMNFPIDKRRQTGFLQPSYSHDSIDGTGITAPYYLNLAPNYDATITPNFMSRRKLKLDNRFRYLTTTSVGKIQFNYLPNDKAYKSFVVDRLANPGIVPKADLRYLGLRNKYQRYGFSLIDHTAIQKNLFLEINYTRVSDDNYVFDFDHDFRPEAVADPSKLTLPSGPKLLGQENTQNATALLQQAMLTYRNPIGSFSAQTTQYQTLHPFLGPLGSESYRRLPELDFQSNPIDLPANFETKVAANYATFKMRTVPFSSPLTTGKRYYARPALMYPYSEPGWFIKPRVQYNMVSYQELTLTAADRTAGRPTHSSMSIPLYDLDSGLIFERPAAINHEQYVQTFEPRVYYLYVPNRKQATLPLFDSSPNNFDYNQLFRDNRYSGHDRVSDANQVSLGIFNRLLTSDAGQEKANFGIGRILYFRNRTLHLPDLSNPTRRWSPLAAIANYQIDPLWNVNANLVREPLNRSLFSSVTAQYRPTAVQVVNLGYQFDRSNHFDPVVRKPLHLRAAKLSSAWALTPELRLLGKLDYDLNLKTASDILVGLEIHSCCTVARAAWCKKRKPSASLINREHDYTLLLQLVFKGLAGTNNADNTLRSVIPGYAPNDHAF